MPTRSANRLLILGWDAADWLIIRQLFERRLLPNLQRLVDEGAHAQLATLEPRLSPLLWSSIATGKTADKHGILNFVEPDPEGGGIRLSASTTRRTKALWNILTQSGLRSNVVSWYASHPAEPIAGVCVSNLFQQGAPVGPKALWPLHPASVHPAAWTDRIAAARLRPEEVTAQTLQIMVPRLSSVGRDDPRIRTLAQHVAQCTSVHRAAMALLAQPGWDCTMVFQEAIDTIGHHFMQYRPPRMPHVSNADHELFREVMDGIYRLHDQMLGEILKCAGADTTVILLSDHGFHSDHHRPVTSDLTPEQRARVEASWHRPFGVLVMAGPGIAQGRQLSSAGILDIAPTALTLLGLPIAQDMDGRPLSEAFAQPIPHDTIPSWDAREGDAGMHPPDLRQDPFEAHSAIQQLIDLGYMAALPEQTHAQLEMVRLETQFNLGMVLLTTGRPAPAIPEFESLVAAKPAESRYAIPLAKALIACLRPGAAVTALQAFLHHDPANADARALLAAAWISLGRRDDAKQIVEQLERESADRPALAQPLGDLRVALNCWSEAEAHFDRASQHDPRSIPAHIGKARIDLGQDRYEQAAEHCLDALELQPAAAEAHYLLGVALAWLDDLDHAAQSFAMVVSMQPGHLEAHRFLAAIHRRMGRAAAASEHEAAAERLVQSLAMSPEQASVAAQESLKGPREWLSHRSAAAGDHTS